MSERDTDMPGLSVGAAGVIILALFLLVWGLRQQKRKDTARQEGEEVSIVETGQRGVPKIGR